MNNLFKIKLSKITIVVLSIAGLYTLVFSAVYGYNKFLSAPAVLGRILTETGKLSSDKIVERLTNNTWCTDVLDEPGHPDYDEKRFYSDHTFTSEFHSDVAWGPTTGQWGLDRSDKGYWVIATNYKSRLGFNGKHFSVSPDDLEDMESREIIAFNGNAIAIYPKSTDLNNIVGIKYYKDCNLVLGSNKSKSQ